MYIEPNETTIATVFLDQITPTGSAFGARTDNGEVVFINARIVTAVSLQEGDTLQAAIIPNYEDKRHSVQWRAIRVTVTQRTAAPAPEEEPAALANSPFDNLTDELNNLLYIHGPMRTATLARMMGSTTVEVGALCRGLHATGQLARAEVYSLPNNSRPSHNVWALSINDFDVDPDEEEED